MKEKKRKGKMKYKEENCKKLKGWTNWERKRKGQLKKIMRGKKGKQVKGGGKLKNKME